MKYGRGGSWSLPLWDMKCDDAFGFGPILVGTTPPPSVGGDAPSQGGFGDFSIFYSLSEGQARSNQCGLGRPEKIVSSSSSNLGVDFKNSSDDLKICSPSALLPMWTPQNRVSPVKGVPCTESSSLEKKSAQDVHIASCDMRYEI
jgi:hypothetical protein